MTRFETIKNMSLEEMADFLRDVNPEDISEKIRYCEKHCPWKNKCDIDLIDPDQCYDIEYKDTMKVWLLEEVEQNG